MRRLKTKPFGEIEVDETQELNFLNGLFGFENNKKFYLLENQKSPFVWLQSSEEPNLAFIMIHPLQFKTDYKLQISEDDLNDIEINEKNMKNELLNFVIVTIPENPSKMTVNLQGPVIINIKKRIGKQAISLNENYTVKCPILDEMKETHGKKEEEEEKVKEEEKKERGN